MNIYRYQRNVSRRLLAWSAVSIAVGAALMAAGGSWARGFGLQAAIWGGVDAAIAVFGEIQSRRRGQAPPDEPTEIRDRVRLRRLLVLNARLDVLYVAAGIAVSAVFLRRPFWAGTGVGVVVQGAFLLVFDTLHARALPTETPAWYDPADEHP